MSLRGEQDDLNWYDIYGPNIPNAELEKEYEDLAKMETVHYQPKVSSAEKEVSSAETENGHDTNLTAATDHDDEPYLIEKRDVVEVTVDGRFGHANHSRDEPMKTIVGKDISRSDIKVEGRVESADTI